MKAPVSVVIPCYNSRSTIDRAVASVARQTWRPAEVIIVDDGSSDGTIEVLCEMERKFEEGWLKISRHEKNKGPAAARNTGWDLATQPYVAFLDADDTWHPLKIEIQLQYMQSHPEVTITGHRYRWLKEQKLEVSPLPKHYEIHPISRWKMLISNKLSTPTIMLQRDLPFRFESAKRFSEDYFLWLSILFAGYKGAFIDLELAYIYKAPYGTEGLSGRLWAMEKGELDTYWRLHDKGLISMPTFVGLSAFSLAKYVRRIIVSKL